MINGLQSYATQAMVKSFIGENGLREAKETKTQETSQPLSRLDELKSAIREGTYTTNVDALAGKMAEELI